MKAFLLLYNFEILVLL